MDVGVPKIRTKPNECCQPSKWTHHGLQWHVHLFRTYTCRFLPWVLSTLNINFRLGILHDTSKKYQKIPSSAGDAPFFPSPQGSHWPWLCVPSPPCESSGAPPPLRKAPRWAPAACAPARRRALSRSWATPERRAVAKPRAWPGPRDGSSWVK